MGALTKTWGENIQNGSLFELIYDLDGIRLFDSLGIKLKTRGKGIIFELLYDSEGIQLFDSSVIYLKHKS